MTFWTIGYLATWVIVIAMGFGGLMMLFVASQFQKELGWIGLIMILISVTGAWKLIMVINITVAMAG